MGSTATYNEALVVFRDLVEDLPEREGLANEYVRGGCELIGDLFGLPGVELADRKEQVLADLIRIPQFANPIDLPRYGVEPYKYTTL